jgi:hypothetical protein
MKVPSSLQSFRAVVAPLWLRRRRQSLHTRRARNPLSMCIAGAHMVSTEAREEKTKKSHTPRSPPKNGHDRLPSASAARGGSRHRTPERKRGGCAHPCPCKGHERSEQMARGLPRGRSPSTASASRWRSRASRTGSSTTVSDVDSNR